MGPPGASRSDAPRPDALCIARPDGVCWPGARSSLSVPGILRASVSEPMGPRNSSHRVVSSGGASEPARAPRQAGQPAKPGTPRSVVRGAQPAGTGLPNPSVGAAPQDRTAGTGPPSQSVGARAVTVAPGTALITFDQ